MLQRFKFEFAVLMISFCVYSAIGFLFACNTQLVYHPDYICDLYYGFDNAFHTTSFVRHPLLKVFSKALNIVLDGLNSRTISFLLITICSVLLSVQNLYLYKILKEIVLLSKKISLLFTCFFCVFGNNLLLSFTFDSYVFSGCLMMMFLFYYFKAEKNVQAMTLKQLFLFSILIGGVTITNFVKVVLVSLFSVFRRSYYKVILLISGIIAIGYLAFYNKVKDSILFISSHTSIKDVFSEGSNRHFRDITDYFLGSSFLIPNIKISDIYYIDGTKIDAVVGQYFSDLELLFFLILISTMFISIVKNLRNKVVQILLLCFLVDIFIHLVVGLGLREAYVFSGNYAFIFPIIMGISYQSIINRKYKRLYLYSLAILFLFSFVMNINVLLKLYQFALDFYPNLDT